MPAALVDEANGDLGDSEADTVAAELVADVETGTEELRDSAPVLLPRVLDKVCHTSIFYTSFLVIQTFIRTTTHTICYSSLT